MGKAPRERGYCKTVDKSLCLAYNNIRVKAIDLVGKLDPGDVNKLLALFFIPIDDGILFCVICDEVVKIILSVNACDNICLYFKIVNVAESVKRFAALLFGFEQKAGERRGGRAKVRGRLRRGGIRDKIKVC